MNPVAKLAIAGLNMGASALVGKGLGAAWTKATGNQPPAISADSEDSLRRRQLRYHPRAATFLQVNFRYGRP